MKWNNTFSKKKIIENVKPYVSLNKKIILLLPYLIVAALLIIAPMIMLLVKSTQNYDSSGQPVDSLQLLKQDSTWTIMGRSIYLGLIAAFISLLLAFPFAYIVGRSKSKVFKLISFSLILSPLLVFTISRIFALKILLLSIFDNQEKIKQEWIMVLGMVYLYMPFMMIPLYSVLQQMPDSLIEASKDLGYGRFSSIIKVVVPFSLKAIFSGLAIVFMLSATSLAISGALLRDNTISFNMIGNKLDELSANMRSSDVNAIQGSTLALITIAIMMGVYIMLYFIPQIIRKIKGGVNV